MKNKTKIFGIVATLLLLMIGLSPAIIADIPDPRQDSTTVEEVYIDNWNETIGLCDTWDDEGVDADLSAEQEEDLDFIIDEINTNITELEQQQGGGSTWFYRGWPFAPDNWTFSKSVWESANDSFHLYLSWYRAGYLLNFQWVIWFAMIKLRGIFLRRGDPSLVLCKEFAEDVIYEIVQGSYRFELIENWWNEVDGIWIKAWWSWFPFPQYEFHSWGHQ